MTHINKQKFLAELGRLLTFMFEEDRQTALAMYAKMFEDVGDEQMLLQYLVSPTRQAVVLARAYDSKERKLQVRSQSRDAGDQAEYDEVPSFVLAIDRLREDAASQGLVSVPEDKDQLSLFDESFAPESEHQAPVYAEAESEYEAPICAEEDSECEAPIYAEADSAQAAPIYAEAEEPEPSLYSAPAEEPQEAYEAPESQREVPVSAGQAASEPEDLPEEDSAPQEEPRSVDAFADAVDAFLADFSISDGELITKPAEAPVPGPAPAPSPEEPVKEASRPLVLDLPRMPDATLTGTLPDELPATVRSPKVFLLVVYIILAVPLTLLGIAILLVPTLVFLALAVTVISLGAIGFSSAFGGFAVLADILVVLGASLIVLALGLLLLWIFVWFIGGAITGLIRAVFQLGRKWCYKEVAVR